MLLEVKQINFTMPKKVGVAKGCTKDCQQILFIFGPPNRRPDKGRFVQLCIGQGLSSRSRPHTIFAAENDCDFGQKQ